MTKWYYRDFLNRKIGPLSADEFQDCVMEGEIKPETRVWRSGLGSWTTYADLLQQEAVCASVTRGPATRTAPRSSSYGTLIALGASTIHRRPSSSRLASSSVAPHADRAVFEKSASNRRRARRSPRRAKVDPQTAMEAHWLGQQFVRVAVVTTALLLIHFVILEAITAPSKTKTAARPPAPKADQTGPIVQTSGFSTASYTLPPDFSRIVEGQR